ncbi:hypothetical protein BDR26DRAFT_915928 [Obelidium mucronatum]|nr:hypothetical protein BDR26DRAFT_915928 [Obelidium mucronatum]
MKHVILDNPMGQTTVSRLLKFLAASIPKEYLPSFKTGKALHKAVDQLQLSVDCKRHVISFDEISISLPANYCEDARTFYDSMEPIVYIRPLRKVIETTLQDRSLQNHFVYAFEEQKDSENNRIYSEAWSSGRCKELQEMLPAGATPLLLTMGSDSAVATKLGKNSFHPFHFDFANLNKDYRVILSNRSRKLVFYMPDIKRKSDSQSNSPPWFTTFKRAFFHAVLRLVLSDIEDWIKYGVHLESPDGRIRHFYPVLMHVNGDYPELCLLATTIAGKSAPMTCCFVPEDHLCDCGDPCGKHYDVKTTATMKTLIEQGNLLATKTARTKFFKSKGIVEYIQNAFYAFGDTFCIHRAITPDKLHVNESGVFAHHLWEFIKVIIEKEHTVIGKDLLDSRFRRLPTFPGVKTFKNGVTPHSCLTKDDYQSIMKSLLLCVEDLLDDNHLECLKTFIDLVMSISASSFTDSDLDAMQVQFEIFEEQVKCFLQNSPYAHMIRSLGAPDGYCTEAVEASHVSDVVKAYLATNRKNMEEQMIRFVARQDKMLLVCRIFGLNNSKERSMTGESHKLLKYLFQTSISQLNRAADLDLNGIQKKIASHVNVKDNKIKFYRTVKIVDHDEDGKETIQMIKGGKKDQEHCLYDVGMGNGIKGCRWRLGGVVAYFKVWSKESEASFALLQKYETLLPRMQNGTGLWIFEKPTPGSTVVIPLKKLGMRAWVVPYFQDGNEGASGRVYLNSYSDRYVWSQIPRSF